MCERRQGAIFLRKAGVPVTSRYFSLLCCLGNLEGYTGVSKNRGTPKSSILIGFSIINHPFWGYHYFWKHPYNVFSLALFVSCQWAQLMQWARQLLLGRCLQMRAGISELGKLTPDTLLSSVFRLQVWKMIIPCQGISTR